MPRFLLNAVMCFLPLTVCAEVASAANPVVTAATTAASGTCPSIPVTQTIYLASQSQVWFDFTYTRGNAGDQYQIQWVEPNGTVYTTDSFTQTGTGGSYCYNYFMAISGYPPAGLPGSWTANLLWNGTPVSSAGFTIAPLCTSLTASIAGVENYLISTGSSSVLFSFVTTPANCGWTAAGSSAITALSSSTGVGGGNITAYFLQNNSSAVVVDTVTLTSGSTSYTLYVTLNPAACAFTFSPPSLSFSSAGGSQQLSVTSNLAVCEWFLQTGATWLQYSSGLLTGSQTLSITASADTGPARTSSLTSYGLVTNISVPVTPGRCH
jgi:hypothetical protein